MDNKGIKFRPYQMVLDKNGKGVSGAIPFLQNNSKMNYSGLVRAGTGAGKTLIMLYMLDWMYKKIEEKEGCLDHGYMLIVCPGSVQNHIKDELIEWGFADESSIHVMNKETKSKRVNVYQKKLLKKVRGEDSYIETDLKFKYLIIRYGHLRSDVLDILSMERSKANGNRILGMVLDEVHNVKNRKTLVAKALIKLSNLVYNKNGRMLLGFTATFQSSGVNDLWTMLHVLNRKKFSSYWKFINHYMIIEDNGFGNEIKGLKRKTYKALQIRLRRYLYFISDDVVSNFIPKIVRQKLIVSLTGKERKFYNTLEKDFMAKVGEDIIITPYTMTTQIELRKLLICPKLVHESLGYGVGIEAILTHAIENNDGHIVIACPFNSPFKYFRQYLESEGVDPSMIYQIHGGLDIDVVQSRVKAWERGSENRESISVLFCTIKFGVGFELKTCHNMYFLGYEWVFWENEQMEGRAQRGNKKWCNVWYVYHENTIDDIMLKKLNKRKKMTSLTFSEFENKNEKIDNINK